VCFVLPSLAGGGAERVAVEILNALDADSWDRSLYLFSPEGPYLEQLDETVHVTSGSSTGVVGRWLALRRYLAQTRPQIVVSFLSYFSTLTAARLAWPATRVVFALGTPMSAFLEDRDYEWRRPLRRQLFVAAARMGYAATDLVIATSSGVARDLTSGFGIDPSRIRVIPNPVDLDAVRRAAADPLPAEHASRWAPPVIVAAGRLAEAKNYPLLIEALALVRSHVPARLFVLGQGDRAEALRGLAIERGLGDVITWCGFQANPWQYMARADVFALTSRYEGFGNVLVEAMACGVPVVATRSAGTEDIIRDGVDGVLTAHRADAVASALVRVLVDKEERARLATAARSAAERFAQPVIAQRYHEALIGALA
jgi:glycosyltransferase involved in cell wall biosynthesis